MFSLCWTHHVLRLEPDFTRKWWVGILLLIIYLKKGETNVELKTRDGLPCQPQSSHRHNLYVKVALYTNLNDINAVHTQGGKEENLLDPQCFKLCRISSCAGCCVTAFCLKSLPATRWRKKKLIVCSTVLQIKENFQSIHITD